MSLSRYRKDLDAVSQSLVRRILALLLGVYHPTEDQDEIDGMVERLAPAITAEVRVARNRAHRVALQRLIEECPDDRIPYLPDQRGYSQQSVEKVLRKSLRGPSHTVAQKISGALVRHTEQAARDTVVDAVIDEEWKDDEETRSPEDATRSDAAPSLEEDTGAGEEAGRRPGSSRLKIDWGDLLDDDDSDLQRDLDWALHQNEVPTRPIGWARVMTGAETCAFCTMLASRPGAGDRRFYTTADAAGGELAQAQHQGTALFVNRFHDNCDCIVVPVYDENHWLGREQAEYLYENVYLKALDGKPATGWRSNKYSENDVVKTLEKWLREHADEVQLPRLREMV